VLTGVEKTAGRFNPTLPPAVQTLEEPQNGQNSDILAPA